MALLYQKTAISYRIGENKNSNTIPIENYFINMYKKYNMHEDLNYIFSE